MKIPFKRKLAPSNDGKALNLNKEHLKDNVQLESNINNTVDNSNPINSETNYQICFMCKKIISSEIKKPEWKWNLNTIQPMCIVCYERKSKEYEKIINYCNECNKRLGFIRYNPKPLWGVNGQLCRACWDLKNSTFKK